jgi:hypothetical protein
MFFHLCVLFRFI